MGVFKSLGGLWDLSPLSLLFLECLRLLLSQSCLVRMICLVISPKQGANLWSHQEGEPEETSLSKLILLGISL